MVYIYTKGFIIVASIITIIWILWIIYILSLSCLNLPLHELGQLRLTVKGKGNPWNRADGNAIPPSYLRHSPKTTLGLRLDRNEHHGARGDALFSWCIRAAASRKQQRLPSLATQAFGSKRGQAAWQMGLPHHNAAGVPTLCLGCWSRSLGG